MKKIAILLIISLSFSVLAAEESVYSEIARFRHYESGADESDLKVRPFLNSSQVKKKKQNAPETNEGF